MGISIVQKGDLHKAEKYLSQLKEATRLEILDRYGREGVAALAAATPVDTGNTANHWYYEVTHNNSGSSIAWKNSNVVRGVNIAIILQYGHGTRNGGYVQGRDYINPAIQPIFDKIADAAWREVTKL